MELNSSVFDCSVFHRRIRPKENTFQYNLYTFYIDLDEIEILDRETSFFSSERFNLFSFYREDHLDFGFSSAKENILFYLRTKGIQNVEKICLLTHLRIIGYIFNPVCFYYCFDSAGNSVCVIAEVHNTFGEMKPFLIMRSADSESPFSLRETKFFYVSPYEEFDTEFEFSLRDVSDRFSLKIDDYRNNEKIFTSAYSGRRKPFSDSEILKRFLLHPLMTLRVIALIHWQALILYLKKIKFYRKNEKLELQKGVYLGKDYS
ncbi:MAG TPA: DUF1365 domain-containing protein [Leptospiraceae bacterium]|nr:DUF1365 domain-containing protein [Leptospiraceae bacterium]HNF15055.1 DUF1365 domain-containing protein [Leptospiraceae bacterium]HNF23177.1 DUF1365 domain-containing protein [Leptospiraceae bacterium]HNI98162.1 DUF1365 domain-containing protein [Leptospiraceae bacterium]HNM01973.1 DUF1365 domain-containing protein [Leptospiraceae bacterium]